MTESDLERSAFRHLFVTMTLHQSLHDIRPATPVPTPFSPAAFVPRRTLIAALIAVAASAPALFAQATGPNPASGTNASTASADQPVKLDAFVSTGTRFNDRTVTTSAVPIDVLVGADVRENGYTEIGQVLQEQIPSLDFPRPTITDGTDHVRPASLRGLSPDETLVLVNGKRRHTSALVNLNGSVGRGSSAVDLNAFPPASIGSIEVLRDGAAAQYGSDAIAGVINLLLRKDIGAELSTTVGQNDASDGAIVETAFNGGVPLGDGGFLNATAFYRSRGLTNRAGLDARQQYFGRDPVTGAPVAIGSVANVYNGTPDPREASFNRRDSIQGDPFIHEGGIFLNSEVPLGNGLKAYAFGGYTYRDGTSAANWRQPGNSNNVRSIYPNGFLPLINAKIIDGSISAGVDGRFDAWDWSLSETAGLSQIRYYTKNSVNASYGAASPTNFYDGNLQFEQATTNFDFSRPFDIGLSAPLKVAAGAEYRYEDYQIKPGDVASWGNGGQLVLDGPAAGTQPAFGAQGFPGFRPTDATDKSRGNIAGYIEGDNQLTQQWDLDLAVRAEHYQVAGSTVDGKIATRYELLSWLAARASANTGFRAPSLAQSYFTTTSTNFINGLPYDIKTFQVTDPAARLLGATDLKPEKSVNYSGGFTLQPIEHLTATIDYYYIKIDDRVVLSSNFTNNIATFLSSQGFPGIGGGRYFTNAVDTRTQGADVTARYNWKFANGDRLNLTGAFNYNQTRVTYIKPTPANVLAVTNGTPIFDRQSQLRFEQGTPRQTYTMGATYDLRKMFTFTAREVRYGSVLSPGTTAPTDQWLGAKWLTDIEVAYHWNTRLTFAIGANNVFDVYPDKNNAANNTSGINEYSSFSPFGFNGGFYYTRATFKF